MVGHCSVLGVPRLQNGQAPLLQAPRCLLFLTWVCCASSSVHRGGFRYSYQVHVGKDSTPGWDMQQITIHTGCCACGKAQFLLEEEWETPMQPTGTAQGLGSIVGTHGGSSMEQPVYWQRNTDCAFLPSRNSSVWLSCCHFLDNSLISYRKQYEKHWDRSTILNPVSLQSRVAEMLSALKAHVPSGGRSLNPEHPLLHENC